MRIGFSGPGNTGGPMALDRLKADSLSRWMLQEQAAGVRVRARR